MTLRRKILLILLIIPVAMIIVLIGWPASGLELIFLVTGVPILVLNAWEFFPQNADDIYSGKFKIEPNKLAVYPEGTFMKSKAFVVLIISSIAFILLVSIYASLRSYIDRVPFLFALTIFLIKLASKLWHFLTAPTIFISLLVFLLLWLFRKQISMVVKDIKPIGYAKFTDIFHQPILTPVPEGNSPTSKPENGKSDVPETGPAISWLIEHGIDGKAMNLLLDIDGRDITKSYLLSKIDELGINSERIPFNATKDQKEVFYRGMLEALYGYLFPIFCSMEMKNNDKVARFALKPGVREGLIERLNRQNNLPESGVI